MCLFSWVTTKKLGEHKDQELMEKLRRLWRQINGRGVDGGKIGDSLLVKGKYVLILWENCGKMGKYVFYNGTFPYINDILTLYIPNIMV